MGGIWLPAVASFRCWVRWTGMGSALIGAGRFSALAAGIRAANSPALEEVPASASGISWVHVNGRSPMAHLPETVGAGCAFLDYALARLKKLTDSTCARMVVPSLLTLRGEAGLVGFQTAYQA